MVVFWLLNSGVYAPLNFALGIISVTFAVYLVHRMNVADKESHPVHLTFRAPLYWLWLFGEIIKSNFAVAKVILSHKMDISPTLLECKAYQKTELGRVIYANSITLTPGTLTLLLREDGELVIHALQQSGAEDVQSGGMDLQVRKMGMDTYSQIEKDRGLTSPDKETGAA